jgi:hypothetical protein
MQSYNIYNIDFTKLPAWLTPQALQTDRVLVLLRACCYPFVALHNIFLKYRKAKIYQLTITPQVCYLQMLLNDKYDSTERRIEIVDAEWHLPLFVYTEAESKPVYIRKQSEADPTYVYVDGEAGAVQNDFVVKVPAAVSFSEAEMRAAIDSYKLFGTTYTIQLT